jgi:hypothetical protein
MKDDLHLAKWIARRDKIFVHLVKLNSTLMYVEAYVEAPMCGVKNKFQAVAVAVRKACCALLAAKNCYYFSTRVCALGLHGVCFFLECCSESGERARQHRGKPTDDKVNHLPQAPQEMGCL